MVNEFTVPDDKTFVCTFIASPDDMKEAIESCRKYLNSEEETEFSNVFMFMLYGLLKYGNTEITINAELQESLESLVDEKVPETKTSLTGFSRAELVCIISELCQHQQTPLRGNLKSNGFRPVVFRF